MNLNSAVALAGLLTIACIGCSGGYSYVTYKDIIFHGPSNARIDSMYAGDPNQIPAVFVRTPTGDVFELKALPPAVVNKIKDVQHVRDGLLDRYYCGSTTLVYQGGRLTQWSFGEGPLEIGAHQKGPFRSFPMTRNQIHEMFGAPEREGRASKPMFRFF